MAYLVNEVTDLVNSRFLLSQANIDATMNDSEEFLSQMTNAITVFSPDFMDLNFDFPVVPTNDYSPTAPSIPNTSARTVARISVPDLSNVTIPNVVVPTLVVTPPTITFPSAPNAIAIEDPGSMPVISTEFDIPNRPIYTLPVVPTFTELTLPNKPEYTSIFFNEVAPIMTMVSPVVTFNYNEQAYQTALMSAIEAKLLTSLTSGGTGLGAEIEAAIWDRARNRLEVEHVKLHDDTLSYFSSRGWTTPPGVLAARIKEVSTETTRQLLDLNRDISVEQARLAQEQIKVIIATVVQYEGISRQHADQVANRCFESAKYTQQVAIDIFNTVVAQHTLELEAYKTAAAIFESRIRTALVDLERYKAEMEGARLSSDLQERYLRIYTAQLQGIQIMSEMYKTEMQSAEIRGNLERIKLETYREKVNAYSARLSARTAEYEGYSASINGELAKSQVFESQVRANISTMEGVKIQADINIAQANAIIQRNNSLVARYSAEIDGYKAETQAAISELQGTLSAYGLQLQGYDSAIKLAAVKMDADVKSSDIRLSHENNRVQLQLKENEINLSMALDTHKIQVEALKSGANVSAQLAAAAMSSVSAAAQLSYSGSHGYSDSDSLSTQHIYTHSE
jgi:hypothetical protein